MGMDGVIIGMMVLGFSCLTGFISYWTGRFKGYEKGYTEGWKDRAKKHEQRKNSWDVV